jgi:hypothetical protein
MNALLQDAITTLHERGLAPEIEGGGRYIKVRFINERGAIARCARIRNL